MSDKTINSYENWKIPQVGHERPVDIQDNDENLTKDIINKAYKEGYNKGYAESLAQASNDITRIKEILKKTIDASEIKIQEVYDEISNELVKLSILITKKIIKKELERDPGILRNIIQEALKQIPINSEKLTVTINTNDLELIKDGGFFDILSGYNVVPEDTMISGEVIISNNITKIHTSIDQQIDVILNTVTISD